MQPVPSFALDGSTLLTMGGVLGTLISAIALLFRQLMAAKDSQITLLIKSMEMQAAASAKETENQRIVMMTEIQALKADRDKYRDIVFEAARERRGARSNPS